MPFVTLDMIKSKLYEGTAVYLETNEDEFAIVERDAAELISLYSGIEIPVTVNDSPEWVITPCAWFINFLMCSRISGLSEETISLAESNFTKARDICSSHRDKPVLANKANRVFDIGVTVL